MLLLAVVICKAWFLLISPTRPESLDKQGSIEYLIRFDWFPVSQFNLIAVAGRFYRIAHCILGQATMSEKF